MVVESSISDTLGSNWARKKKFDSGPWHPQGLNMYACPPMIFDDMIAQMVEQSNPRSGSVWYHFVSATHIDGCIMSDKWALKTMAFLHRCPTAHISMRKHRNIGAIRIVVSNVLYFVELGGGVDDVPGWRCDGAHVELGFRWSWWLIITFSWNVNNCSLFCLFFSKYYALGICMGWRILWQCQHSHSINN